MIAIIIEDQELRDVVESVYSTMKVADELMSLQSTRDDEPLFTRLSNQADRLELIHNKLLTVLNK